MGTTVLCLWFHLISFFFPGLHSGIAFCCPAFLGCFNCDSVSQLTWVKLGSFEGSVSTWLNTPQLGLV